jgi:PAS domain S-box-containing protein
MATDCVKDNRRILIIDDTPSIHDDFRKILVPNLQEAGELEVLESELFGGSPVNLPESGIKFELDSAYQGQEGLELVRKSLREDSPYAMAFVDIRMPPGWDGVETVARIWKDDPDLEVVICTAYSDYSWHEFFKRLGRSDQLLILKKPFDHIEVHQIAHALTTKRRLAAQAKAYLESLRDKVDEKTLALSEANRRIEMVMNATAEGICGIGTRNEVTFINPAVSQITGYSPGELLGRSLDVILALPVTPSVAPNRPRGAPLYHHVRAKDGKTVPIEYLRSEMRDNGEIVGSVVAFHDVTEKKVLETQLLQAQKLEAIGQLAAGIAHEINNPLAYVSGNLSTLGSYADYLVRMIPDWAHGDEKLNYIRKDLPDLVAETFEGVIRMQGIVGGLKSFARQGEDVKETLDLKNAVESALQLVGHQFKHKCRVFKEFGDVPPVSCYANQIGQVLVNMLVNASHAIEKSGDVSIRTRSEGSNAVIEIADTGKGISEADKSKLFTPFFTTKPVGKGTGLGLSISYGIVKNHGGDIEVESEPGKGSVFRIKLPLTGPV